jgi:hypothetical protein
MIRPLGGQPRAGLSAAMGLATLRAYLVFLATINYQYSFFDIDFTGIDDQGRKKGVSL